MAKLTLHENKIALHSRFEDREAAKRVTGREWNKIHKVWLYPVRAEVLNELTQSFPGLEVSPKVSEAVLQVAMREQATAKIKADGWENATATEPLPVMVKPFLHQVAAYEIACKILGIFEAGDLK